MLGDFKLTGFDELSQSFEGAPAMTTAELERYMVGATHYLEGEIQERTPAAHGTLKQSFGSEVRRLADSVLGVVGTPLAYAIPVELGTRPHFPPVDAIEDWVKVKLGLTGPEGRRVAFAIARKIAKKGTQGAFMVRNAFEAARAELERQFRATVEAIKRHLAGGAA